MFARPALAILLACLCVGLRAPAAEPLELEGVAVDPQRRSIRFPCQVALASGFLEYGLVQEQGKVHESLLTTAISPVKIHAAMLLLGARDATEAAPPPARITAEYLATAPKLVGDPVEITIHWNTPDGAPRSVPLSEWIWDRRKQAPMEPGRWIYTGSIIHQGKFLAQHERSLLALVTDPSALINNPRPGRDQTDLWEVNIFAAQPVGTIVELEIRLLQ